jgi:hypothetical protein
MTNILEELNKNCKSCALCGDKSVDGGLCLNCEEGMKEY